jgi:LmbE family N-acetylglucosaminyl deacetylase
MASSAILEAFQDDKKWFCGVVVTDGRGSPRSGFYASASGAEMQAFRKKEQKKAAVVGEFGSLVLLDYPSTAVKDRDWIHELVALLTKTAPSVVYTHNLADKHPTHVAVAVRTIEAIRLLPEKKRPKKLLGCEVWRGLDWMVDNDKVVLENSTRENLKHALLGVYDSQITGGKRYDLATLGRQRANATYLGPYGVDRSTAVGFAMDLTPLIENPKMDLSEFVVGHISRFAQEVRLTITKLG